MALNATIFHFEVELSDVDRGVYETLALRVACHPSETEEALITRVLAYCLEYTEGISFSNGLADADAPAIAVRDLTGALQTWVDIGAPSPERLHKAMKASPRVAVYTHKDPVRLLRDWNAARIHRAGDLEIFSFDSAFLAGLVAHLSRRMAFSLAVTGGHLYVNLGKATLDGPLLRHFLGPAGS